MKTICVRKKRENQNIHAFQQIYNCLFSSIFLIHSHSSRFITKRISQLFAVEYIKLYFDFLFDIIIIIIFCTSFEPHISN